MEKWKSDMMKLVYNHNYGIVFWILLQNENDINCGSGRIDIDWSYHMKIALEYDLNLLNCYCLPQNYPPY